MSKDDYWSSEEFEDKLTLALIAMFESKYKSKHVKGIKVREKDYRYYKRSGLYIPSNSRLFYALEEEEGLSPGCFELSCDKLPRQAFVCMSNLDGSLGSKAKGGSDFKGIAALLGVKRVNFLPKGYKRRGSGPLYEHCIFSYDGNAIDGERHFVSVDASGVIHSCDFTLTNKFPDRYGKCESFSLSECAPNILYQRSFSAASALQMEADKRFCWSIKAEEAGVSVELGCMQEEVKSLLYARSLPVTETGRKKPILHLVESHKRRLKNGTDIDITPFLRGSQKVEMNGTIFTVKAPLFKKDNLSENSQVNYYENN